MAKKSAVWGIDIGNSSLKALRICPAAEPGKLELLAFDFIEHSKILSQPGAEPAEILNETLKAFLSRNSTRGDRVAISVSGQNTISRFLKLPPVDPKKIPDIIKYEAKQWLPFDLQDVIWDFQPIGGDAPPGEIPLDTEIGMFAMKRDIAMKTLEPYLQNKVNVDCIQSSPLALYNYIAFDQLQVGETDEQYDPDNPPESVVVLCVGTDATDVVVTNGYSIWIRSIPIGGNLFTRALTKGLKLTFSKAEYLKRNAASAQDPKAVFQAMRPVFNDLLSEVHRSLEFYQSLNRRAKFTKILSLGNAMKMPGLRQFLTQNLGYEVTKLNGFNRLVGSEVLDNPLFKDNLVSFPVAYGLAIQQLGDSSLSTNLIPKEIVIDRIVRDKKPWALAGAAAIMLGCVFQFAGASQALKTVSSGDYSSVESQAKNVKTYSDKMISETKKTVDEFATIDNIGVNLTKNVEGRITWLELFKALNVCLPVEKKKLDDQEAEEIAKQDRVFISNIEAITSDDLAAWFAPLKEYKKYFPDDEEVIAALNASAGGAAAEGAAAAAPTASAPKVKIPQSHPERLALITGPAAGTKGRVVQMSGYHYHNADVAESLMGGGYIRRQLLRKLKFGEVILPSALEKQRKENAQKAKDVVSMKELGICFPTLMDIPKITETTLLNPRVVLEIFMEQQRNRLKTQRGPGGGTGGFGGGGGFGGDFGGGGGFGPGGGGGADTRAFADPFASQPTGGGGVDFSKIADKIGAKDKIKLRRFDFVVQFGWIETPPSVREKILEDRRLAELAKQQASGGQSVLEGEVLDGAQTAPANSAESSAPQPAPNAAGTPAPAPQPAPDAAGTPAPGAADPPAPTPQPAPPENP